MNETYSKISIGLQVKYPLFFSDFNETWKLSPQIFKKYLNIRFHENPSCPLRRDGLRQTHGGVNNRFSQFSERAH